MEEYFIENIHGDDFICLKKLKNNNTGNTSHYLLEEHIKIGL